jgi:hypothetical protein
VAFDGIEVFVGQVDPNGFVVFGGLEIQIGIRHQVKQNDLHGSSS